MRGNKVGVSLHTTKKERVPIAFRKPTVGSFPIVWGVGWFVPIRQCAAYPTLILIQYNEKHAIFLIFGPLSFAWGALYTPLSWPFVEIISSHVLSHLSWPPSRHRDSP